LLFKIFIRDFSFEDRVVEGLCNNVLLVGIFGIIGCQYNAYGFINPMPAGIAAAVIGRVFH
jgi:hypothetical protein